MSELPQPLSELLAIPHPLDDHYVGILQLHLDAKDVLLRVLRVRKVSLRA
jgi:hypothetical protein